MMRMKNFDGKNLSEVFSNKNTNTNTSNEPEEIRIANFAEELKDRSNYDGIDICFVIDVTASMGPYIEGSKASIRTIINDAKASLEKLNAKEESLKFSIVAYRDHLPQDNTFVTKICDFTTSSEAEKFLNELTANGGGDIAEAVMDGIHDALYNVQWREKSEKFMFLVLDAPPHGKRFGSSSDGFPEGCPCGYSEVNMLPYMRDMKIDLTVIKIDSQIDTMIKIFSQYINIDVFQPKIFQQKNNSMSSTDYTKEVSMNLASNFSRKVNSNLNLY